LVASRPVKLINVAVPAATLVPLLFGPKFGREKT